VRCLPSDNFESAKKKSNCVSACAMRQVAESTEDVYGPGVPDRAGTARPRRSCAPVLYFVRKCKVMAEATLSAKNQIVIPREAREALQVKPGDKLAVVVRGDKVIVLRKPKSPHTAIRGLARAAYPESHVQKERQSWE
jgi:AbrB family looped-hinge helix DNA binding protein